MQLLPHDRVNILQIRYVLFRDENRLHPCGSGGHGLFFQPADGENPSAQGDFSRHGDGTAHRFAGEGAYQGRGHGHTRTGAVFGDRSLRELNVQIFCFVKIFGNAVPVRHRADITHGNLGGFLHHVS